MKNGTGLSAAGHAKWQNTFKLKLVVSALSVGWVRKMLLLFIVSYKCLPFIRMFIASIETPFVSRISHFSVPWGAGITH